MSTGRKNNGRHFACRRVVLAPGLVSISTSMSTSISFFLFRTSLCNEALKQSTRRGRCRAAGGANERTAALSVEVGVELVPSRLSQSAASCQLP
ncbi:hypothetical protein ACLKA6_012236 [Drosophila palustris]